MSEVAEYGLYVDWNGDGDFSDSGENITDDLIDGTITRGFGGPLARVPMVGRATIVLRNLSQAYSPPLDADVVPRREMKLEMTYGGTTATLLRGFLDSVVPSFGRYGDRRATLECVDGMSLLDLYEGEIALQTGVYADDIIGGVVSAVYTPPATNYQAGINYFATSAEGWQHEGEETEQIRASQKIEEACKSDWGRFFIAGNGTAIYYNRWQMPLDETTELTLDDTMLRMMYQKGASTIYNYVEVTCFPRTVGQMEEVVGRISQQDAPQIEANDSRLFVIRFRDPTNAKIRVGGKDCLTPVVATDYVCTDDMGGQGNDVTASVTPSAMFYGDHAEVTLANGLAYPVYVQKLQVRGLAVRAREAVAMVADDATSIAAYQRRKLQIKAPLISDPSEAQLLANYLLEYYKNPLNEVTGLEILANKNATWMAAVRDLELADRVSVTETQTGLSGFLGHIYKLQHRIRTKYEHRVVFDLEEAYSIPGTPFRIDVSQFDSGHVLIY